MHYRLISMIVLAGSFFPFSIPASAAETSESSVSTQQQDREIYGWQLMTPEERAAYRSRMRAANTIAERDKIRQQHHEEMVTRAKDRGMTLPPDPPRDSRGGSGYGPGAR